MTDEEPQIKEVEPIELPKYKTKYLGFGLKAIITERRKARR